MIKLVAGLGNPGEKYSKTRHNAGFLFLDAFVTKNSLTWIPKPEFEAFITEYVVRGEKVFLLKPQTFMNRSGQAVGKIARYYKFQPEDILVIHDELDFLPGQIKLKKNGGHAGNNGLRDIIAHLNSRDFYRLRIGIGRPPAGVNVADYVLSVPMSQDRKLIASAIERGNSVFDQLISENIELVMNQFNA
jgi:PTH1 family peptidyl-tRNA hydrolase